MYVVEDRLWTTEDGEIVLEGDWRAKALYATPGSQLSEPPKVLEFQAEKPKVEKKAESPVEDKAVKAPENKAQGKKVK